MVEFNGHKNEIHFITNPKPGNERELNVNRHIVKMNTEYKNVFKDFRIYKDYWIQNKHYEWVKIKKNVYMKPGEFNCLVNHYNIIKSAYKRGVENLMICEDDVIIDFDRFTTMLENIPSDYNIVQFHLVVFGEPEENVHWKLLDNECFNRVIGDEKFCGLCVYMLNRTGMKNYLNYFKYEFVPADFPFMYRKYGIENLNHYVVNNKYRGVVNWWSFNSEINK